MTDPATLLLVEDDPVIRTFLADNLTADGYDLLVAATLEEAMRELEFKRPELAIVDLAHLSGTLRAADDLSRDDQVRGG
jgi:DNA-binding response OmpR family regulator